MAEEKRAVKVKAKINLKYDRDIIKIGEEFAVRKSDVTGMSEKGYIETVSEK
ncbi:hypothetical protein CPJCM30710_24860 [Clostridium polyendosporum]|uniref:DUF7210 domain-containing protein n=1 Tax=Clostridium polyendosporum TaxID=69208 RepID=A0A919VGX5_9CLOT|nr:hypothetical protein [Clostridium polyendosporum]GIM29820.1 hypothetical protein CPJCM30710_24860 [Clostridium polyendosporum]